MQTAECEDACSRFIRVILFPSGKIRNRLIKKGLRTTIGASPFQEDNRAGGNVAVNTLKISL